MAEKSEKMRRNRTSFSFPDFSLRRLLLQGARAARGSPPLSTRCDVEKGTNNNNNSGIKNEKLSTSSSNQKVIIDFPSSFLSLFSFL